MEVHVEHCKHFTGGHYVGRPGILGNPFSVKQHGRAAAIEKYREWFNLQYTTGNKELIDEAHKLATILKDKDEITLVCWCAPEACHASVIGKALRTIIDRNII